MYQRPRSCKGRPGLTSGDQGRKILASQELVAPEEKGEKEKDGKKKSAASKGGGCRGGVGPSRARRSTISLSPSFLAVPLDPEQEKKE